MVTGCASHGETHDLSNIKEAGQWVSIKNAPLDCNYLLRGDRIYGVGFCEPLDSIDWDEFWKEFLIPRSSMVITEKHGKETTKWIKRDSSEFSLKHVNVATFEVNIHSGEQSLYAKDKRYVYYPREIMTCCDDDEYFRCYDIIFEGDVRIPGADPKTFKYLGAGYAVDKNNMYWEGKKIKWNDNIITALQADPYATYIPFDYGLPKDVEKEPTYIR